MSSGHNKSNYGHTPKFIYTLDSSDVMLYPPTLAVPLVHGYNPVSIDIKVVFPAPFGPSSPNISPASTFKHILLTAIFLALPPYSSYTLHKSLQNKGYSFIS